MHFAQFVGDRQRPHQTEISIRAGGQAVQCIGGYHLLQQCIEITATALIGLAVGMANDFHGVNGVFVASSHNLGGSINPNVLAKRFRELRTACRETKFFIIWNRAIAGNRKWIHGQWMKLRDF
ncbi:hypothetical protein RHG98_02360 [Thermosynechococcus sp. PP22]|uniref:hypothetical protein n=1 Tax=Thermosynechococcus sp. PP22 TaxID=3074082 RepID=UPI002873E2E8|nr:hypothetical protein [Thermosynechococcus sp. PP22]WNC22726.1 hypothetical protein RHG98_02360 [Thermosynechococcus sp. PP22]